MSLGKGAVESIVQEMVRELLLERASAPVAPKYENEYIAPVTEAGGRPACQREEGWFHGIDRAAHPELVARLQEKTSSQLGVGHRGLRFRTELYLRMREGHADAQDAVHSEIPPDFAKQQGWIPLVTRCKDRQEYLLYPNHGRRLSDESRKTVEGSPGADIQIIAGDGLSSNALLKNGPATLAALTQALTAAGFSLGPKWFVKFARIGVQDDIGVLTKAKATVVLVGERPGLGTGDSLSIYLAINPRLDQDNAEKNCISNVRPIGIRPEEAAALTVKILREGFARGGGGVALGYGFKRV